jgi:hypothetical protein
MSPKPVASVWRMTKFVRMTMVGRTSIRPGGGSTFLEPLQPAVDPFPGSRRRLQLARIQHRTRGMAISSGVFSTTDTPRSDTRVRAALPGPFRGARGRSRVSYRDGATAGESQVIQNYHVLHERTALECEPQRAPDASEPRRAKHRVPRLEATRNGPTPASIPGWTVPRNGPRESIDRRSAIA